MKRVGIIVAAFSGLMTLAFGLPCWASEGGEAAGLPQMDATLFPGLLFWLAVTFLLFFIMMKTTGVPGIQETRARRKNVIDVDLSSARVASDDIQKIIDANDAALEEARLRAQKTVNDIIHAANSEAAEQRGKQQHELSHRLQVTEDNLNQAKTLAIKETPQFINDLVNEIVSKIMPSEVGGAKAKG